MRVDPERIESHRLENVFQTIVLVVAMLGLLGPLGAVFAGRAGLVWALLLGGLSAIVAPRIPSHLVLRMYGGRELLPTEAVDLQRALEVVARRAGLSSSPRLAYIPSAVPNAFAVGRRNDAVIAVTAGLLQRFDLRELVGVLTHETAHVASGDVALMSAGRRR